MKRYGEKATIKALQNGHRIRLNDWYTLNAGYRIINTNDEMIGYITQDLFNKLLRNRTIKLSGGGFSYTEYRINEFQV